MAKKKRKGKYELMRTSIKMRKILQQYRLSVGLDFSGYIEITIIEPIEDIIVGSVTGANWSGAMEKAHQLLYPSEKKVKWNAELSTVSQF